MSDRVHLRELSRRLNHNPGYIFKLKTRGVLVFDKNGLIDEEQARAAIAAARDPSKWYMRQINDRQRTAHRGLATPPPSESIALSPSGSYMRARTARESYVAKLSKLDYEERIGQLINAKEARDAQFNLARQVRARMLVIPDRLAALLAAETDQTKVREILAREIRQALSTAIAVPEEDAAVELK